MCNLYARGKFAPRRFGVKQYNRGVLLLLSITTAARRRRHSLLINLTFAHGERYAVQFKVSPDHQGGRRFRS